MNSVETPDDGPPKPPPGSLAETYRAWRHFFWLLSAIIAVVLFYAEENWRGPYAWERFAKARAAQGDVLKASAYVPPAVLGEENFVTAPAVAPLFRMRSQAIAPRFDAASTALKLNKRDLSNCWVKARTDFVAWHVAFLQPTNQNRHEVLRTVEVVTNVSIGIAASNVLAGLSEADPVFEKIREASGRPYSRFDLPYLQDDPAAILLPHLAPLKHLSQGLQLRASAEVALGQTGKAAEDIRLMFYLANACKTEPILISQLVRIAQVHLAFQPLAEGMNQWSDEQLRSFQEQLGAFDFSADMYRALQAERVLFGGGMMEYVRRSPDKIQILNAIQSNGGNLQGEIAGALLNFAPSGWLDFEKLNYMRMYGDYLLPIIDVPGHQISPAVARKAEERIKSVVRHTGPGLILRHRFFCALMVPAISRAARRAAFAQAGIEQANVACALQRFRLAHGVYPESLQSLAPQFIAKVPHDIINGQPLKYRRGEDGQYVLYSVGWNETDDGGRAAMTKSGEADGRGVSVELEQGDWVWRPLD
jgi:hypothetical protein